MLAPLLLLTSLAAVPSARAGAPPDPADVAAAGAPADPAAAATVDHGVWQQVLSAHATSAGRVDYAGMAADARLDAYVESLAKGALPADRDAQLALWINAYNALTVAVVADHWPVASIRDIGDGGPWKVFRFTVAGQTVTLDDIEHGRIRKLADGRIHAVVNCASNGCPPLPTQAMLPGTVQSQLTANAKRWVATNGVVVDKAAGTARFNQIFDWYAEDFAGSAAKVGGVPGLDGKLADAAAWCAKYADAETAAFLKAGGYDAGWADYDWGVNKK